MTKLKRAVFLDRDGVLIEDRPFITHPDQLRLFPDVAESITRLKEKGWLTMVVTNQTVVARGLASLETVAMIHYELQKHLLATHPTAKIDLFYVCPHHPQADMPEYRVNCNCRKPASGLLLQAAADWQIDLSQSYMVGDRFSDIVAGQRAGCRTIWLQTGQHTAPPIITTENMPTDIQADFTCQTLTEAITFILERTP